MSRYTARLRSLEHRLVPSACPLCAGAPVIDFHTIHAGESVPPARLCTACGVQHKVFIVEFDDEPTVPAAKDIMPAPERPSKALVRRRRFYGTE